MTANSLIRVMIVDDHPLVRVGMSTVVNQQPDMTIAAVAEGGPRVLELFRELQPDVVLMDLRLRGDSGARLTGAIRREFPAARVLVISNYDGDEDIHQALAAGAMGYLFKSVGEDERAVAAFPGVQAADFGGEADAFGGGEAGHAHGVDEAGGGERGHVAHHGVEA